MDDFNNQILTKMLDLTTSRHRALAQNLANVNTPGYRRKDLDFLEEFSEAVKNGPDALNSLDLEAQVDPKAPIRADGNSVVLEKEMAEMSKNVLTHQLAMRMLTMRIAMVRMAITGRS